MGLRNPRLAALPDVRTSDEILADELNKLRDKPLEYVMFMFPFDTEPSIQVVELPAKYRARFPGCKYGPDEWACEFLDRLGEEIRVRGFDGSTPVSPIRFSTVSGHEIGKSTLCAWLIKFILDTRPFSKGSVTAVTDEQLRTKTWAELGKWHALSMTRHWFKYSSARGSMSLAHSNPKYSGTWRCDARTCREEKSEAFAGQHAPTSTSFYIFDEASGVPNKVYEVREGGLSSGEPMVFDFGNGTRSTGEFFENCVGKYRHRYITNSIDSRTVAITNKEKIEQDCLDWGEDSDRFRVRWRGLFPARGSVQFMSSDDVLAAMTREMESNEKQHSVVLGVDVARFGDDASVVYARRGRDARSWPPRFHRGLNSIQLADRVAEFFNELAALGLRPSMIFVDGGGGYGSGVADQLNLRGYPTIEVMPGGGALNQDAYRYKSDELWGNLRDALNQLYLPPRDDPTGTLLFEEMTQREYGFIQGGQRIHLESKKDFKKRIGRSPDCTDALALTFAHGMATIPANTSTLAPPVTSNHDYDPYAERFG
jgi:hypothetical protein